MAKVQFSSTVQLKKYHGFDGKQSVSLNDGEALAVSDDKAKQLVADFPKNFSKVADSSAAKQVKKKGEVKKEEAGEADGAAKALKVAEENVLSSEAILKKARQVVADMPSPGTAGSAKAKKALKDKLAKAEKAEAAAEKALAKDEEKLDDLKGDEE